MNDLIRDFVEQTGNSQAIDNPYDVASVPTLTPDIARPVAPAAMEARPQPGLFLSFLTTIMFPASQFFISLPVFIVVSLIFAQSDKGGRLAGMLVGSQGCVLALALAAGIACTWIAKHRVFSLSPVRIMHLVAIVGLVLPTAMVARSFYNVALLGWTEITDRLPGLKVVDELNTMSQMGDIVANVPLPLMLFAMAIVPALAEEIVFRGIIGRGLTARYGLISGILMTSILFGMAHVHPAHAVSVIPLGIVMHVLYVTTRSFWAPVLFHFCNNAFAVVGSVAAHQAGQSASVADAPALPWYVIVAGAGSVAAWFYLLSVTRTRLIREDGSEWNPGYDSTELPRHESTARFLPQLPVGGTLAAFACGAIFFGSLVTFAVTNAIPEQAMIRLFWF